MTDSPEAVAYLRDLMTGFKAPWFLCGGWAVDTWLGRQTRDHGDVDLSVLHRDHQAVFDHFQGWALVGHDPNVPDDTSEPWTGRPLDLPAHIHVPKRDSPLSTLPTATHTRFEFEFMVNESTDTDCVLNRPLDVRVPLSRCQLPSPWGVPTAAPEVILFFKGGGAEGRPPTKPYRPRDEQDFKALLPTLTAAQREWLHESYAKIRPDHPWLSRLEGRPGTA